MLKLLTALIAWIRPAPKRQPREWTWLLGVAGYEIDGAIVYFPAWRFVSASGRVEHVFGLMRRDGEERYGSLWRVSAN